jgi:hypothetical protein
MSKRKLRVGDRVRYVGALNSRGTITRCRPDDDGYRYVVHWESGNHHAGYTQSTLELIQNGLEVAWRWLEDNGYG